MTLKEHWSREKSNRDKVYLSLEGIFYKAYERSAYILYTQWRPLVPSVRRVKYMGNEAVVGYGGRWNSSLFEASGGYALSFNSGDVFPPNIGGRTNGFPVRCVKE